MHLHSQDPGRHRLLQRQQAMAADRQPSEYALHVAGLGDETSALDQAFELERLSRIIQEFLVIKY
jgi:hypothetical protein